METTFFKAQKVSPILPPPTVEQQHNMESERKDSGNQKKFGEMIENDEI